MAEHPNDNLYRVDFDRPEDDMEIAFYLPLTKEEMAIINGVEDPDEPTEVCDGVFWNMVSTNR